MKTSFTHTLRAPNERGFTLIELMIVVVIIGVLSAIAYPSYSAHVLKSRRSDAWNALTLQQTLLDRCYARSFSYASGACPDLPATNYPVTSSQLYYSIAISNQTATSYTLTATPVAGKSQVADTTCASFSIDQSNQKIGKDVGGTVQSICWAP
ncbi:type IV pilus assembly protein PilE [Undibacterium sp. GrIS 1.8]|uniref:type IV pilin protein n=1 Tax=unclassified Undibacterium TaxID=2630295 RepID=UPI003391017E